MANAPAKTANNKKPNMTAADAAKLVHRLVPDLDDNGQPKLDKDKNVKMKEQEITEEDVLNFADYPDKVVVVTTQGEKLVHEKA